MLLVSPSTLLFVLRTVAHLWRQERQNRNVQEIVKRGAELYDKLSGFIEDFEKLGERLSQARDSYDSTFVKFKKGRGNVIRQAEMLRELGIKPSKSIPEELVEESNARLGTGRSERSRTSRSEKPAKSCSGFSH